MIPAADILRAAVIAGLAVAAGLALRPLAATGRRGIWALLLAPYLTPALLVGYAYSNFALALVHHPAANAVWYAALLCLKLTPVAAIALHFSPRPLSAEAAHCWRLARGRTDWRFRWRAGCGRAPMTAFALVFLLAFGDFEMASLMNVRTWPVTLFDGHAGGLPLGRSLALAAGPFIVELLVLGSVMALLARQRGSRQEAGPRPEAAGAAAWALLLAANALILCVPAAVVFHGTAQGWRVLAENFALGREIATSLAFGATAAAAAYALAPRRWWTAVAASLPGLLGPLVLALLVGAAMQTAWLCAWRDTPAPLAAALMLLLLPLAVLLKHLLRRTTPASAVHAARLLGGRSGRHLVWALSTRRHLWAIFLLFCWGYLDLTASSILAPIGAAPVTVRLYNLMHYGQTAVLSAMVTAAIAAPLAAMAAIVASRRLWVRL